MLSCASLINIVVFYFKFGEKISCLHFIGVSLMLLCIICISVAATAAKEEVEDFDSDDTMGLSQVTAGILAIGCGLVGAMLMSTKHLFIKLFKSNYSGVDMGVDSSMCEYALYTFLLIPLSDEIDIGWKEIGIGAGAGVLMCLGRIFISIGVSTGLAAPAQALMSTLALHQALWSAAVAGQTLSFFQILGLIFGILGVFSISFFDHLATKVKRANKLKELRNSLSTIEEVK